MAALHIKKGDNVVVLSGDDKGVIGEVLAVSPEEGKVIVKGVNIIHKHVKPRRQGEAGCDLRFQRGSDLPPVRQGGQSDAQDQHDRKERQNEENGDPRGCAQKVRLPGAEVRRQGTWQD